MFDSIMILAKCGVTAEDAIKAAAVLIKALEQFPTEDAIGSIRYNPSLTRFQKWRLIRRLKKINIERDKRKGRKYSSL